MSGNLSRRDDFDPDRRQENREDPHTARSQRRERRTDRNHRRGDNHHQARNAGRQPLPTVEDLLRMLRSMPSLIALGALTPVQANSIRGMIDSMLRALNSSNGRAGSSRGPTPPID